MQILITDSNSKRFLSFSLTPRNTTGDAFKNIYIRVRKLRRELRTPVEMYAIRPKQIPANINLKQLINWNKSMNQINEMSFFVPSQSAHATGGLVRMEESVQKPKMIRTVASVPWDILETIVK